LVKFTADCIKRLHFVYHWPAGPLEGEPPMQKPVGLTRLRALPAPDVWHARTSGGLFAIEPRSTITVRLNAAGLKSGDVAGLALFSAMAATPGHPESGPRDAEAAAGRYFTGLKTRPCAWLGVERGRGGFTLIQFVAHDARADRAPLGNGVVWLRTDCDFVGNRVGCRYSVAGPDFVSIGEAAPMGEGPGSARALWCSLFCCTLTSHAEGGYADFDSLLSATAWAGRQDGAS
jgi:xylan 1,4-beta-xylosidase